MIKAICIEKPHRAIALTDGWLCIKYLEGGEESLTTFADISKGDVITYGRSHPYNPQAEREKVLDRLDKEIHIREDEMNRRGGLEDNIVTMSGYYASAGALDWVRKVLIEGMRDTIRQDGKQEQP